MRLQGAPGSILATTKLFRDNPRRGPVLIRRTVDQYPKPKRASCSWRWRLTRSACSAVILSASVMIDGRALAQGDLALGQGEKHALAVRHLRSDWAALDDDIRRGRAIDFEQRVKLVKKALTLAEAAFGRNHPNTLRSINYLAVLYDSRGHHREAESLFVRALESSERVLGPEHPDTFRAVRNLARTYQVQGRYREAEPLFIRTLASSERVRGRKHPDTLTALHELADLYLRQARYEEAEPLYVRALALGEGVRGREHPGTAPIIRGLGSLYENQGRYGEAEPLLIRALETTERVRGREHQETLTSLNNLAGLYLLQRRYSEAEPLWTRALETNERVRGREHPATLTSVNNLAALYASQHRDAEAEVLMIRALRANKGLRGREHAITLASAINLATLYSSQGRYADAEPLLARVLEAGARVYGRDNLFTVASASSMASLYSEQGRHTEADRLLTRTLETSERVFGREHQVTAFIATGLAFSRLSLDRAASALEPARLAVSSVRSRRLGAVPGPFAEAQRGREERSRAIDVSLLADAAWSAAEARGTDRASLAAESFTALQDAMAGTTGRAVVQMAVRRIADEAGPGLEVLVRERESLNDQWAVNGASYSASLADVREDALRQTLRAERGRIEARSEAIDTILRRDFPEYFALVRPEALDVRTAQEMLAPDEAVLIVVPTRFGTHVMALSRTGLEWVRSEWTKTEIDGAVGRLLGSIRVTMAGGRYSYDRQTAFSLFRQVVTPVAASLEGKRHVFVVAAGSLTSLPFGILVTDEPRGENDDPEALRTTSWFADAHALIQIPSIQSLQFLRRYRQRPDPGEQAASRFVGFGNPALDGPTDPEARRRCFGGRGPTGTAADAIALPGRTRNGGMIANVAALRRLCPLAGSGPELANMRIAFAAPPTALFVGEQATEATLRQMDLSQFRILAFSTHGLVAGELGNGAEPGLVFTPPRLASTDDDGYLTASEISALRLDADWVILSACNTAAGDGSPGAAGLSGLARAFFYAGARNLLASHWPVSDASSARLTVRTIELQRDTPRLSRAEVLQRAMREVRNDSTHAAWAHPGIWAPFSLIGDGAR